jgi:hypothetical protein
MIASNSAAAERLRRFRERRRRGVIAVINVEIMAADVPLLVRAGCLPLDQAKSPTRDQLSSAIHKLLDEWAQDQRIKWRRERAYHAKRVSGCIAGG